MAEGMMTEMNMQKKMCVINEAFPPEIRFSLTQRRQSSKVILRHSCKEEFTEWVKSLFLFHSSRLCLPAAGTA
jgi:hypothetical protein